MQTSSNPRVSGMSIGAYKQDGIDSYSAQEVKEMIKRHGGADIEESEFSKLFANKTTITDSDLENAFDKNKSGFVTTDEVQQGLKDKNISFASPIASLYMDDKKSDYDIKDVMASLKSASESNSLSMDKLKGILGEGRINDATIKEKMDSNKDGYLTQQELQFFVADNNLDTQNSLKNYGNDKYSGYSVPQVKKMLKEEFNIDASEDQILDKVAAYMQDFVKKNYNQNIPKDQLVDQLKKHKIIDDNMLRHVFDANKDGKLSGDEMQNALKSGGTSSEKKYRYDGDGKYNYSNENIQKMLKDNLGSDVSTKDIEGKLGKNINDRSIFDKMDTNKDGVLVESEVKNAFNIKTPTSDRALNYETDSSDVYKPEELTNLLNTFLGNSSAIKQDQVAEIFGGDTQISDLQILRKMDSNSDGKLSEAEIKATLKLS